MSLKLSKVIGLGASFMALVALACGGLGAQPTPVPPPPPTPIPPTQTPVPPPTNTAAPVPTPVPSPASGSAFTGGFDDFSEDYGGWEVFAGSSIDSGILRLGPFSNCADVGSNDPYACFTQCLACGIVSEYEMQVDAAYLSGVSDRTFGMVLRFEDANGNAVVDGQDYYLDFSISVYDQYFVVWEYNRGRWNRVYNTFSSAIRPGNNINTLYAYSYDSGSSIDLYVNGEFVANVFDIPATQGSVGLAVGGRAVEVGFDNFEISIAP